MSVRNRNVPSIVINPCKTRQGCCQLSIASRVHPIQSNESIARFLFVKNTHTQTNDSTVRCNHSTSVIAKKYVADCLSRCIHSELVSYRPARSGEIPWICPARHLLENVHMVHPIYYKMSIWYTLYITKCSYWCGTYKLFARTTTPQHAKPAEANLPVPR